MANVLQELCDTLIMPAALPVLRESCVMPALVMQDFKEEVKKKNDTIRVPLPQDFGDADTMNVSSDSTSTDLDDPYVDIVLDSWKYKQFQMSDKEMAEAVEGGVLPSAAEAAIKSLANSIDLALIGLHVDIPYFYGTAGTTPTANTDIIGVRKVLQANLCPSSDRRLAMDIEAEAKMLALFAEADKKGEAISTQALREASLGRLFGFDSFSDQLIAAFTPGTLRTGTPLVNGAVAAAAMTMNIDGGASAGTIKIGDRFTVAGVVGQYVFTAIATATAGAVTGAAFYPPAPTGGFANDAAITILASHTPNLAFNKNAFALAIRPLDDTQSESSTISIATDPVSGMPLRLETWRIPGKASRVWRFDILFGVKTLRPELAAILLG